MAGVFVLLILIALIYALCYYIYKVYIYSPPVENEQLRNRCVIITGASRGIGEQLAYEYSRYNCRLVLAARSIDILKNQVASKCRSLGATQVECVEFDASTEQACKDLIEKTIGFYQRIDILVLNHTASVYQPYFNSDIPTNVQNMKKLFDTNFFGYFHTAMSALPHLNQSGTKQRPAQIIAISSLTGACPLPQTTIYGTTKHAIQGFFLNLARELRTSELYESRVTSTVAILGLIATEKALDTTDRSLHMFAASVQKTAQAILAAGVYGQSRLFYPHVLGLIPPLYYIFTPLFDLVARLGN
ncbi:unnamed protein product [Adineta ricciae]|uniref:Uncharacterized protein n=1 Tax=Adineta ricciae TaxID=249248 RepID=A0A816AIP3_ADIRI|nr:unnamed protein product [Adineta ricciae]CAF1598633.1 unnamed protein product [Adineta ricciae]